MATSKTPKTFDPFKTFDVSLEERKAAEERAKIRAQNKQTWQTKALNPFRPSGDYLFDPAVQRFISMRASQYDYFKATPKTAAYGIGLFIIPLFGTFYFVNKDRTKREKAYRAGEVKYTDREFKFI